MSTNTYVGVKKDVTFPIEVGGNTLVNLQKLILYILADKTDEEIKIAQEKIQKSEFDEDWYEHVAFLSFMISYIEKTAHEKGLTVVENLDNPTVQGS